MNYLCKCGWEGTEDELDVVEDYHCHSETGQQLADLSYAQCPECGEEPDEADEVIETNEMEPVTKRDEENGKNSQEILYQD